MGTLRKTAEKMRNAVINASGTASSVTLTEHGSSLDMCRIWEKVFLWSNHIRDDFLPYQQGEKAVFVTFNCCVEGRCEVRLQNGSYLYMEPGMFCINTTEPRDGYFYPTASYEGIELALDLTQDTFVPDALSDYGVTRQMLLEKLGGQSGVMLGRMNEEENENVMTLRECLAQKDIPIEKLRMLSLELLLSLTGDRRTDMGGQYVTQGQRRIARAAHDEMVRDLSARHTVEEMAQHAGVSASALKKYFSSVYGKPVSVFLRDLRIAKAQELLAGTKKSVGEIAQQCGYASQSKFTAAFRGAANMTPLEYRRLHYKGEQKNAAQ